ncbi:MAG: acyltransferase [Muribaculaceae bacterium]|nr:acyltransferase [Muribaculaceae bacterium]
MKTTTCDLSAKPRFEILDGLRGVAALIVVAFHIFEIHSKGPALQIINHGYLAVDFFFALSGFVLGYAYDDRWRNGMSTGGFLVRRIIRLQPMVIAGATFGLLTYYFGLADIESTGVGVLLLVWLMSCFMIPITKTLDVRGWEEGYALDGPQWTLGFEYVANLLYALFIRRMPRWMLALFVVSFAFFTIDVTLNLDTFGLLAGRMKERYTLIGGWSLAPTQLYIGFTRLLYPFFAGLLVYRLGMRIKVRGGFYLCSAIIAAVLLMPRVGIGAYEWSNGLYEAFCVLVVFPVVLMIGAGTFEQGKGTTKCCQWLGKISYPIYITHYPLIYILFDWTLKHPNFPLEVHVFNGVALFIFAVAIAYAFEKLYDAPIRSRLTKRWKAHKHH